MALLLTELVESFGILDELIDCKFPLTHKLRFDCFSFHFKNNLHTQLPFIIYSRLTSSS